MRPLLLSGVRILVASYVGVCAALFLLQRSMLYFPTPVSDGARASVVTLPTESGPVLAATRPLPSPRALLYFGGNAEDVTYSLPELAEAFPRHAIFALHYRGYGGSAGSPSEGALYTDALALYERVRTAHPEVTVMGRSLGSGLAVRVAALRPVARLVLVTPYDSILGVAQERFAVFPVRWLLKDKYEAWRDAPRVSAPTTILAAEKDEVIPRASAELLLTRFQPRVATYAVIPGAGHNTISDSPEYWRRVTDSGR